MKAPGRGGRGVPPQRKVSVPGVFEPFPKWSEFKWCFRMNGSPRHRWLLPQDSTSPRLESSKSLWIMMIIWECWLLWMIIMSKLPNSVTDHLVEAGMLGSVQKLIPSAAFFGQITLIFAKLSQLVVGKVTGDRSMLSLICQACYVECFSHWVLQYLKEERPRE